MSNPTQLESQAKPKFTFVNIIFFVIFGVLTGVLWAYGSPIPLIPGAVHFRTFAFIIPAIGFLFGPVSGFFSGYIGTVVWALLGGYFIAPHTLLADGITVGLSAALPALVMLKNKSLEDWISASKSKFIWVSLFWSILFGILMILTTSISLAYFTGLSYWYCVLWIGIADVVPIAVTPFIVLLLAPRLKKLQTIIPRV
ncbi:MAG: aminotriazole resistance protein [Ruminococcaceae bacterium]|jgi:energy-coupling factor transport system substrate-specific component|nr:aminotriazole resistance protein [Oscillospiraceae bacterium]